MPHRIYSSLPLALANLDVYFRLFQAQRTAGLHDSAAAALSGQGEFLYTYINLDWPFKDRIIWENSREESSTFKELVYTYSDVNVIATQELFTIIIQ